MYSTDYFSIIVSVLGGLAFFLYGMHLLGTGLEKASGGRLERTLEKMRQQHLQSGAFWCTGHRSGTELFRHHRHRRRSC